MSSFPFFSDNCRQLEFWPDHTLDGLKNHVIRTVDVTNGDFCETICYMEPNCVSYNLKIEANENGKYKRELTNSTFEGQKDKLEKNSEYTFRGAKFKSGKQTKTDKKSIMASKKKTNAK